ncbi:MAG: threonine synthase [Thermodesulfobacteriota bacterium]
MEKFHCPQCKSTYSVEPTRWRCDCGSFLDLPFEPSFDIKKILKRGKTLWRYREAIPIDQDESILSMEEGFTPLESMAWDGHPILVKIDYLFPTGSYKDRGATVLISKLKELGVKKVVEDSSGNAGAAIAAYCARAGIRCEIYVPQGTSLGKLVQIEAYGAILRKVEGSRKRTAEVTMEVASKVYYASHCWNPFFLHGTKTFAFEIWEQMGWTTPDAIVLPVGHGTLLMGAYIGFKELKEAGMIKRIPRLVAVQSGACAPLDRAFKKGWKETKPFETKRETLAEGIAIADPVRGRQILEAMRETDGEVLTVTEREIGVAQREMGMRGHFIEPTAAATIAGLKKYLKHHRKEIIVSTLTGTGLKAAGKR